MTHVEGNNSQKFKNLTKLQRDFYSTDQNLKENNPALYCRKFVTK